MPGLAVRVCPAPVPEAMYAHEGTPGPAPEAELLNPDAQGLTDAHAGPDPGPGWEPGEAPRSTPNATDDPGTKKFPLPTAPGMHGLELRPAGVAVFAKGIVGMLISLCLIPGVAVRLGALRGRVLMDTEGASMEALGTGGRDGAGPR